MTTERSQLKTLAIFYFVLSGLMFFTAALSIVQALFFSTFFNAPTVPSPSQDEFSGLFAGFFVGMAVLLLVFYLTGAILMTIAGLNLRNSSRYTFCLIASIVTCLYFPLGTALGIFSVIFLQKDTVKALFRPQDS
jgi:hypothetical protein